MIPSKVQTASFVGFRYIRLLVENITREEVDKLKRKYSYIFIYSYSKLDLNEFHLKEQRTSIIDLSQSLDDIFKNFKKNTRNEIRKVDHIDGLRFVLPDKNTRASYRFYKKIKIADKVIPDIYKEFNGCIFANTYYNNKLIASISSYDNGEIIRLKHIVSLRKDRNFSDKLAGYATRKLIWELCRYGKKLNYKRLDLAGVNITDPAKQGIVKFKESFGGKITDIYTYRYQRKIFTALKEFIRIFKMNIN